MKKVKIAFGGEILRGKDTGMVMYPTLSGDSCRVSGSTAFGLACL